MFNRDSNEIPCFFLENWMKKWKFSFFFGRWTAWSHRGTLSTKFLKIILTKLIPCSLIGAFTWRYFGVKSCPKIFYWVPKIQHNNCSILKKRLFYASRMFGIVILHQEYFWAILPKDVPLCRSLKVISRIWHETSCQAAIVSPFIGRMNALSI